MLNGSCSPVKPEYPTWTWKFGNKSVHGSNPKIVSGTNLNTVCVFADGHEHDPFKLKVYYFLHISTLKLQIYNKKLQMFCILSKQLRLNYEIWCLFIFNILCFEIWCCKTHFFKFLIKINQLNGQTGRSTNKIRSRVQCQPGLILFRLNPNLWILCWVRVVALIT